MRRMVMLTFDFECCIEEVVASSTHEILRFDFVEEKLMFMMSLKKWAQEFIKQEEVVEHMESMADNKCTLICGGSCVLCPDYIVKIIGIGEELDKIITGVTYRTLRMAARPKGHVYGLTDAEFYKRMSKRREHYTKAQSRQLLQLFKKDLITTKAKV